MSQIKLESLLEQTYDIYHIDEQVECDIRKVVQEYKGDVTINEMLKLSDCQKAVLRSIELQRVGDGQTINFLEEESWQYFGIGVNLEKLKLKGMPKEYIGTSYLFPFAGLSNCNLFLGESIERISILYKTIGAEQISIADEVQGQVSKIFIGKESQGILTGIDVAQSFRGVINKINIGLSAQNDVMNIGVANRGVGQVENISIGTYAQGDVNRIFVGNNLVGKLDNVSIGNSAEGDVRQPFIGQHLIGDMNKIDVGSNALGRVDNVNSFSN